MNLKSVSTKDLEKELERRKSKPGLYRVIKYLRDDRERRYSEPVFIHLVENEDGDKIEVQLVGNFYNKDLNDRQPCCSDEDPNWYSDWEEYEEYSVNYFIGKQVQIDSFHPVKISKLV